MNFSRFFIIVLFLALNSCSKNKKDVIQLYSHQDFLTKVKIVDTACINAENRAKEDIKNDKLSLENECLLWEWKSYFKYDKINLALKKLNINITIVPISVKKNIDSENEHLKIFNGKCYQQVMRRYILDKYDLDTLDSVIKIIDKQYVLEHPDKAFLLSDCDDSDKNSPLDNLRLQLLFDLKYPDGYSIKKKEIYPDSTKIGFILLKDGKIKDLKVKSFFKSKSNEKYKSYFEKEIERLIQTPNWEIVKNCGIPVNCKIEYVFKHK
jgi:hypothetical protein